eukprot:7379636-Prymnesium_polylepis.1
MAQRRLGIAVVHGPQASGAGGLAVPLVRRRQRGVQASAGRLRQGCGARVGRLRGGTVDTAGSAFVGSA